MEKNSLFLQPNPCFFRLKEYRDKGVRPMEDSSIIDLYWARQERALEETDR